MKKGGLVLLLLISVGIANEEEQTIELPQWEDEDMEALESGEWVPGSNLIGRVAKDLLESDLDEPIELDPAIRDLPEEEDESEEWSIQIEGQFLPSYFEEAPVGYLNDPQHLLTTREFRDRDEFLNYHARDTDINLYLYLFDTMQEIPPGESIEKVLQNHFDGESDAAVAFYFLGMPGKTKLAFTASVIKSVSDEEREKVLRLAVEEAMEKSDPLSQLESFLMQSSLRLYWLEKVVAKGGRENSASHTMIFSRKNDPKRAGSVFWGMVEDKPVIFYTIVSILIVALAFFLWFAGKWLSVRKRVYVFPDAAGSPLLDAPFAPGVGGVISFSSATSPPSSQKSEVPDYLHKM